MIRSRVEWGELMGAEPQHEVHPVPRRPAGVARQEGGLARQALSPCARRYNSH